ncbi:hypothetical protein CDAR_571101 [Caerostris darwini]|uniref:Uncharacterized protein n=1 Tax=Caerostris darwini TaxID=1538125 RepID=A0AAV4SMY8_9ARAC|nr:hypothetical protein CDAR_571101 [Caerostris darwini]
MSRILVGSSWLVGVYFSSESMMISNIVYLSVDTSVVSETIASLDMSMSISMFVSVLRSMMILYVITEFVRLGMMVVMLLSWRVVRRKRALASAQHRNASPSGKAFSPFIFAQVLEAFADEVVDGCSDMIASGPQSQWLTPAAYLCLFNTTKSLPVTCCVISGIDKFSAGNRRQRWQSDLLGKSHPKPDLCSGGVPTGSHGRF